MAHHDLPTLAAGDDDLRLGPKADALRFTLLAVGVVGVVAAVLASLLFGGLRHFFLAYLVGWLFCLSLAVGGLFFTLLQHATKAGWSVTIRRVPEALGASFGALLVLAVPLIVAVVFIPGQTQTTADADDAVAAGYYAALPTLYPWAQPYDPAEYLGHGEDHGEDHGEAEHAVVATVDGEVVAIEEAHGDETHVMPHDEPDAIAGVAGHAEGADGQGHHVTEPYTQLNQVATNYAVFKHLEIDEYTAKKAAYLDPLFWTARVVIALAALWILGNWFHGRSTSQDDGEFAETSGRMRSLSYPALLVFAAAITLLSWDTLMSLDPHWYSTIIAPYFFAGSAAAIFAVMAVLFPTLHSHGLLRRAVTVEHLHDVGKFLFAFVFFWGYISFSQYMLIWYGALAEETTWFARRGTSMVAENLAIVGRGEAYAGGYWTIISAALFAGHFFIPFAGLLSRHVKRRPALLGFWGVWVLLFHWLDLYWLVMPELPGGLWHRVPLVEVLASAGLIGLWGWWVVGKLKEHSLVPAGDPRLPESLAFHNI